MKELISNKTYDILKHITQTCLPAVAVFYTSIANIWGLPFGSEISGTVAALVVLLSAFLGFTSAMYKGGAE